jgi:GTP-binding protein HflX
MFRRCADRVIYGLSLPTTMLAAFRTTLEEVATADLIVHVLDASSTTLQRQMLAVEEVLAEIDA